MAVKVDPALRVGAIEIMEDDRLFEDVGVEVVFGAGGIGWRNIEKIAELGEEELVVGALSRSRLPPALAEA